MCNIILITYSSGFWKHERMQNVHGGFDRELAGKGSLITPSHIQRERGTGSVTVWPRPQTNLMDRVFLFPILICCYSPNFGWPPLIKNHPWAYAKFCFVNGRQVAANFLWKWNRGVGRRNNKTCTHRDFENDDSSFVSQKLKGPVPLPLCNYLIFAWWVLTRSLQSLLLVKAIRLVYWADIYHTRPKSLE